MDSIKNKILLSINKNKIDYLLIVIIFIVCLLHTKKRNRLIIKKIELKYYWLTIKINKFMRNY